MVGGGSWAAAQIFAVVSRPYCATQRASIHSGNALSASAVAFGSSASFRNTAFTIPAAYGLSPCFASSTLSVIAA